MEFTFGIITFPHEENLFRINTIINSIEKLNIPSNLYEIIVVGGNAINRKNTSHIPFDENIKKNWITRKKNIITYLARYQNIVYLHDYLKFDHNWYNGFLKFGDNFSVCSNQILTIDNKRYRDWLISPARSEKLNSYLSHKLIQPKNLIPYDITHLNHFVLIGGYYWVAKKSIMHEFPLEETLSWGDGEDFRWCHALQTKYNLSINPYSTNHLLKPKDRYFVEIDTETSEELKNLKIPNNDLIHDYQCYIYRPIISVEKGQNIL